MTEEIVATTDADYEVFGGLIREYWEWLRARYADLPGFIDAVGGHQALDAELNALRQTYGPPEGRVLLARRAGQVSGGIAYRDVHDGSCEVKRLFVPDRFHGRGTGRLLCQSLLAAATATGIGSCAWTPASTTTRRSRCTSRSASTSARRTTSTPRT